MSCACGWDVGRAVLVAGMISCALAVGWRPWEFLQSCNDWTGVREPGT